MLLFIFNSSSLSSSSFLVPTYPVSVLDVQIKLQKDADYEDVCQKIRKLAQAGPQRRVVGYTEVMNESICRKRHFSPVSHMFRIPLYPETWLGPHNPAWWTEMLVIRWPVTLSRLSPGMTMSLDTVTELQNCFFILRSSYRTRVGVSGPLVL